MYGSAFPVFLVFGFNLPKRLVGVCGVDLRAALQQGLHHVQLALPRRQDQGLALDPKIWSFDSSLWWRLVAFRGA